MSTSISVEQEDQAATAVEPGHSAKIKFKVQNSGSSAMQDVTVKLDLTGTDVPFAPLGMTAEKKIRTIAAGSEEEIIYTLIALPDAEAGVYKIPVTITYYDEQGYKYEADDLIGLVIGAQPKISIEIESTELTTKTKAGKIILKIVNYGTTDVKFMRLSLPKSTGYEIISSDSAYIGDIDSDDYETTEFRIKVLGESAEVKVLLEYKDANNNAYTEEKTVSMKLYSPSELGIKQSLTGLWIAIIIIVIAGYIAYRRFKKKKR
jgi:hypothetical protein